MQDRLAFSDFVRRQTQASGFSHAELPDEEVIRRTLAHWEDAQPSYRKFDPETGVDAKGLKFGGVMTVSVKPEGFFSGVCKLEDGDRLEGVYEPRRAGEEPRKRTWAVGKSKLPAKAVDIVLYHADVLAEDDPNYVPKAEWEIISINARATEGEAPIPVGALMHNHFGSTGGTNTGLSDSEFVAKLRESFLYWNDKSSVG